MVVTEAAVLSFGVALILIMFGFMLRRKKVRVEPAPDGLRIGGRPLAWSEMNRLCFSRSRGQGSYRILTDRGVVEFTSDQAAPLDSDGLRNAIVSYARMSEADPAHRPQGFPRHPTDVYEEWAPLERESAAVPSPTVPGAPVARRAKRVGGVLAALGVLIWKIGKWVLIALKFGVKLLKLSKFLPTAITMLVSVWAYSMLWGWKFAAGFVVLILLHEMGHAIVIKAKGLRTGPIVFLPFFGAVINIKDQMLDATVEAETAYGGPAAGALAATGCYGIFMATADPFWLHLAYLGFLMNLFNLIPISPLDGGRVVTAISTWLWVVGLALAGALAFYTMNVILILIVILGIGRAISEWRARRKGGTGDYYRVPGSYRALISFAYFGLCGFLGYMVYHALQIPGAVVGR